LIASQKQIKALQAQVQQLRDGFEVQKESYAALAEAAGETVSS
jgi:hypothetical protein